jgi:hypothetical protein
MEVRVEWSRQGRVHWEQHWLDEHGPVRSRIPDLNDHMSFVNYDLRHNGHREVTEDDAGLLWLEIPHLEQAVMEIHTASKPRREPLPGLVTLFTCHTLLNHHGFFLVPRASGGLRWRGPGLRVQGPGDGLYEAAIALIEQTERLADPPTDTTDEGQLS